MRNCVVVVWLGLIVGCDEGVGGQASEAFEARECPPDSLLTYENFGEQLMLDHCTGCHGDAVAQGDRQGAPVDVNLTTHAQVHDWLELVYERSADDNTSMPVVDNMDPDDRYRLGDWLACGAP